MYKRTVLKAEPLKPHSDLPWTDLSKKDVDNWKTWTKEKEDSKYDNLTNFYMWGIKGHLEKLKNKNYSLNDKNNKSYDIMTIELLPPKRSGLAEIKRPSLMREKTYDVIEPVFLKKSPLPRTPVSRLPTRQLPLPKKLKSCPDDEERRNTLRQIRERYTYSKQFINNGCNNNSSSSGNTSGNSQISSPENDFKQHSSGSCKSEHSSGLLWLPL